MKVTALPFDSVIRAGTSYRSVVVSVQEDSGRVFSRVFFDGRECEDYVDSKRVPHTAGILPDGIIASAWDWIGEKAKHYLRAGGEKAKLEVSGAARWL